MSERGGLPRTGGVPSPHMQPSKPVSISSNRPVHMNLYATWEVDRSSPSCVPRYVKAPLLFGGWWWECVRVGWLISLNGVACLRQTTPTNGVVGFGAVASSWGLKQTIWFPTWPGVFPPHLSVRTSSLLLISSQQSSQNNHHHSFMQSCSWRWQTHVFWLSFLPKPGFPASPAVHEKLFVWCSSNTMLLNHREKKGGWINDERV